MDESSNSESPIFFTKDPWVPSQESPVVSPKPLYFVTADGRKNLRDVSKAYERLAQDMLLDSGSYSDKETLILYYNTNNTNHAVTVRVNNVALWKRNEDEFPGCYQILSEYEIDQYPESLCKILHGESKPKDIPDIDDVFSVLRVPRCIGCVDEHVPLFY